jgi:FkbM family methyltransferase
MLQSRNIEYFYCLGEVTPEAYRAQCGQDYWIHKKYFKDKSSGFFVDVGSNNGVTGSSTFFFEKHLRWKGLCIEPNQSCLLDLYRNRDSVIYPCAIGKDLKIVSFSQIHGDTSVLSFVEEVADARHIERVKRDMQVYGGNLDHVHVLQVPLQTILDFLDISAIDYLKVDVEGSELSVIESIDWQRTSIQIVELEDNYGDSPCHSLMKDLGYTLDSVFDGFVYVYRSDPLSML